MKENSFLIFPKILPITITQDDEYVKYKLSGDLVEDDFIYFLENEMPGVVLGDYSDYQEYGYRSVLYLNDSFKLYAGSYEEERILGSEFEEITLWVKELKAVNSIYEFYIMIFEQHKSITRFEVEEIGIADPETLFWKYLRENDYEEVNRREEMVIGGYFITIIDLKKENQDFVIVYPQYDYSPNYYEFNDHYISVDGFKNNWSSFFKAVLKKDLKEFDGFS